MNKTNIGRGIQVQKKKPYLQAVIYGVVSIASYIYLFMNNVMVMDYFTRGGVYTILPIVTAFYFSFVHGAFASTTLDSLGLQAAKK